MDRCVLIYPMLHGKVRRWCVILANVAIIAIVSHLIIITNVAIVSHLIIITCHEGGRGLLDSLQSIPLVQQLTFMLPPTSLRGGGRGCCCCEGVDGIGSSHHLEAQGGHQGREEVVQGLGPRTNLS